MALTFADIEVGDAMPAYTAGPLTRTHFVRYAGASGDFNPLHHDETFAKKVGLDNVIAHGMLIMGIAGEAVGSWIDHKNLKKISARFLSMTEPIDWNDEEHTTKRATIVVTGNVIKKYKENGEKIIQCDIFAKDLLCSRKFDGYFIAVLS